jgi:N utilization substance protein B
MQLSFALSAGSDLDPEAFFQEEYFRALPPEDDLFSEIPDGEQKNYILSLVNGVREHRKELDDIISSYSRAWKLSRISRTAAEVLRCALYEIRYMPDIPDAAAINEAVELAKSFDEPETVSFINGILGAYMRDNVPTESAD